MKFKLLTVHHGNPSWLAEGLSEYCNKISPFVPFEIEQLRSSSRSRKQASSKLDSESSQLFDALQEGDYVVLFDERGQSFDSIQFSQRINRILISGKKRTVFVVGGAYGVSDVLRRRADLTICLAPFVLNHQIAQLVAIEQIYRSLTILKGLPYHNS